MSYKNQKKIKKELIKKLRAGKADARALNIAHAYKPPAFKEMDSESPFLQRIAKWNRISEEEHTRCPSKPLEPIATENRIVEQDEGYLERERKAMEIAEARKKMIAPLYNKGCYQYIGDAPKEIIQNLGRKI